MNIFDAFEKYQNMMARKSHPMQKLDRAYMEFQKARAEAVEHCLNREEYEAVEYINGTYPE